MNLSEDIIQELINCEKRVTKLEPRQEQSQHNHKQQSAKVEGGGYSFEIFIRKNIDLLTSFSVGLIRKGPEGSIILCRYNGDHGEHRNPDGGKIRGCHKHIFNMECFEYLERSDAYAETTAQYTTVEQALYQLCIDYNITYEGFFDFLPQNGNLFNPT